MLKSLFTESTMQALLITLIMTSTLFGLAALVIVVFSFTAMINAWLTPLFFAMVLNLLALVIGFFATAGDKVKDRDLLGK